MLRLAFARRIKVHPGHLNEKWALRKLASVFLSARRKSARVRKSGFVLERSFNPDGNARQQHLDRKGVAKHVRMATFEFAIGRSDVRELEQTAVASLPVGHRAFGITITAPEEVARIGLGSWRHVFERFDDIGWKRYVDRCPGLRLIEQ